VATVSADGTVTGLAKGTFTVSATVEGKTAISTIEVVNSLASSGWIYWSTSRHYYKFISSVSTWDQARTQAALTNISGFQGRLATLETNEERAFVINYLTTLPIQAQGRPYIWFGVFQDKSSPSYVEPTGGWTWLTGQSFNGSFWGEGEPNNATSLAPEENCAPMNWYLGSPSFNGTFADYPCNVTFTVIGYVIELIPNL
jgi:hypothetical protein